MRGHNGNEILVLGRIAVQSRAVMKILCFLVAFVSFVANTSWPSWRSLFRT